MLLLKSGADDYITKPFDTLELLARIERNIERSRGGTGTNIQIRSLKINPESYTCIVESKELALTKTEFDILLLLCQNPDKVMERDVIMQRIYGENIGDSNVVDVNIKNIRRKMGGHSAEDYIQTVRGKGYVVRS